jgi:hypothetical protein
MWVTNLSLKKRMSFTYKNNFINILLFYNYQLIRHLTIFKITFIKSLVHKKQVLLIVKKLKKR